MFGSRVGFSGSADRIALFRVISNPRWLQPPSRIILNGHNSAKGHAIHFMLRFHNRVFRAPILYSTHHAVIFATAQLSCLHMSTCTVSVITSCDSSSSNRSYSSCISSTFWHTAAAYVLCCSACSV